MKTIIFINLLLYLSTSILDKIVIDITRSNQLNVSEITEKVIAVPLKISNFNSIGIEKVYLIDENLYILQRYQEPPISYSHVYRFDISGNYRGELVAKDPVSKEPLEIIDMQNDETNKRIFLSYSDGYRVFDYNGNLLSHSERALSKFIKYEFIFKGHFWSVEYSNRDGIADYSLVNTDLNGQNKDTLRSLKIELPSFLAKTGTGVFAAPSFSIHNNELYVSFGIDNTIYKVNQHSLTPSYNFEFRNRPASSTDIFGAPEQLIFGKFVKYGYMMKRISYDFLYDTKTRKSYNIKYLRDHNEVTSGIKDDVYNTGCFDINPTNREDYIYFFKKPSDIKESKLYDPKISPTVFLVKLKN